MNDFMQKETCAKCNAPFESHHHKHITRKGVFHTGCYNKGIEIQVKGNYSENCKLLASFVEYAEMHPTQRFWQCLRNWSGRAFIWTGGKSDKSDAVDTFYFEGKNE